MGRERGRLTSPVDSQRELQILDDGLVYGARDCELALLLGVGLTTLQRWRSQFAGNGDGVDRRKASHRHVAHHLREDEHQRILLTFNEPEFAALPPGQIVPVLADRGLYTGSERSFYRVLMPTTKPTGSIAPGHCRSHDQCHDSGRQSQTRCGAGTSPICPPPFVGCGYISIS
jgi:hypothetical protein